MPAQTIRVRFATNRNRIDGPDVFGTTFGTGGPTHYVTGSVDVVRASNLPDTGWRPIVSTLVIDPPSPAQVNVAPKPDLVTTGATGAIAFAQDRIAAHANESAPGYGLVLIHGFASTFLDALRRAAQISYSYRAADIFCFS